MADTELGEYNAFLRNSVALQELLDAVDESVPGAAAELAAYAARLGLVLGASGAAGTVATAVDLWAFAVGFKIMTAEGFGLSFANVAIPIVSSDVNIDGADFWMGLVTAAEATVDIASCTGLNGFPRFLELFANGQETTFTSTAVFDVTINFTFPLVVPNGERRVLMLTGVGGDNRAMLVPSMADMLRPDVTATLEVGFNSTDFDAGTKSSGTYTPNPASGNFQKAVNGGAHTLAPPDSSCCIVVQYTNNASAGAITTSGFTMVTGDAFTTTNGHDFLCHLTRCNGFSHLHVTALQ